MASATLLLPPRSRFGGQRLALGSGRWLARADRVRQDGDQVERHFDVLPRGWPAAAVTRERDAQDAAGHAWLRADPVFIQPDLNGARLLAHGDALGLSPEDAAAFLRPLKPLFGDAGFPIDAPVPDRWYLRLPLDSRLPSMASPEQALGADVFDHFPQGEDSRRWRALLSEAQVVLHNHPRNEERARLGLGPVNSLWFWGGGRAPDRIATGFERVFTDDRTLAAFASAAGAEAAPLPAHWHSAKGEALLDLRHFRELGQVDRHWLSPLFDDLQAGRAVRATLDFADGWRFELKRAHVLRFWRKPLLSLAPRNGEVGE